MIPPNVSDPISARAPFRILVAESEPDVRDHVHRALQGADFIVDFATDGQGVLDALTAQADTPALVILDVAMSRKGGMTTLREIRHRNRSLPVILLSGASAAINRLDAMANGANQFLVKPISSQELREAVHGLLPPVESAVHRIEYLDHRQELNPKQRSWIEDVEPLLDQLAASDVPVLIQGETGVGKEVLARHIHNQSRRGGQIFLKLNCAALPPELVESELFGYERGAFTGAFKSTPGKFELANGGTILLDEIGDMDLRLQAKLLQVLQDREFHRIGAKDSTQVDVRVIAATHRELEAQIANGEFREDLYYRLNVLNIVIPPLRDRQDEIIPLAQSFLRKHASADVAVPEIGPGLRDALLNHAWPGNIRELENVMRRYLVVRTPGLIIDALQRSSRRTMASDRRSAPVLPNGSSGQRAHSNRIGRESFGGHSDSQRVDQSWGSPRNSQFAPGRPPGESSELVKLDQARQAVENEVITKALYATQWNRKRAAALLGVDYKALLYKMKKLGID